MMTFNSESIGLEPMRGGRSLPNWSCARHALFGSSFERRLVFSFHGFGVPICSRSEGLRAWLLGSSCCRPRLTPWNRRPDTTVLWSTVSCKNAF